MKNWCLQSILFEILHKNGKFQQDQTNFTKSSIYPICQKTYHHIKNGYKQEIQHSNSRWVLFFCSNYHRIDIEMKVSSKFHHSWSTVRSLAVEHFERVFTHIFVLVFFPTSKRVVPQSFYARDMVHHSNWSL